MHVKDNINRDAKRLIAQRAVELLDDNDSIIIASGSTIYAFAEAVSYTHLDVYKRQVKDPVISGSLKSNTESAATLEIAYDKAFADENDWPAHTVFRVSAIIRCVRFLPAFRPLDC